MANIIGSAILLIASFILQITVCQYISFGNIAPNLLIFAVSSFGFLGGKTKGTITGFISGLLVDIFCGTVLGFHALLFMYIGFFNGNFKKLIYRDDLKLQVVLVACSDLVYNLVYYALRFLLRGRFNFLYYLLNIILPEVVYTVLLTIIIFLIRTPLEKLFNNLISSRSNSDFV